MSVQQQLSYTPASSTCCCYVNILAGSKYNTLVWLIFTRVFHSPSAMHERVMEVSLAFRLPLLLLLTSAGA